MTADQLRNEPPKLAINPRDTGTLVFTACSHAGLSQCPERCAGHLYAAAALGFGVMGGFHLAGRTFEAIIPRTVRDLEEFDLKVMVTALSNPPTGKLRRAVLCPLGTMFLQVVRSRAVLPLRMFVG